jgi:hypothetical protein
MVTGDPTNTFRRYANETGHVACDIGRDKLASGGCTSKSFESRLNVDSTFNPDGDFDNYFTYAWVDYQSDEMLIKDATTRKNVVDAIEKELNERGLEYNAESPDLMIGYHGATDRVLDEAVVQTYYDEENYSLDTTPGKKIDSWEVGSLVLMIFDAKTGMLIWRASAQAELDEKQVSRSEQRRRLELAVDKMLETMPRDEDTIKSRKEKGSN